MLAKSEILGHFWVTFWHKFGPCCSFLIKKEGTKKRSKKQGPKSHASHATFMQAVRVLDLQVPNNKMDHGRWKMEFGIWQMAQVIEAGRWKWMPGSAIMQRQDNGNLALGPNTPLRARGTVAD